ncbi:DUF3784 domain-containing protein [Clostridium paridis]|uniref:DUF3784 domain-containing protein n=1 Tax=Clostridium paridis TaxID=2803863 RepID=A0A937K4E7_9CLOT|nr:DUF3784 domain-containing protein [Clostridium paridis]MBL4933266.1 DUF3784 domain-containing protein [Clostridium paridis]
MLIGVAILFLIIALLIFSGKGSFLIIGYNIASKEEKEEYNEKKLCRAVGTLCIYISIITALANFFKFNDIYGTFYLVSIFAMIISTIIYINTKCKKTN